MAIHASLPFQQYGRIYRTTVAVRCWIIIVVSILVGIAVLAGGVTAQDPENTDTTSNTAEEEETKDIAAVFEAVDVPTGDEEIPCDTGPDALTQAYGKAIPQTCIEVPYYDTSTERCYYTYVPDPASAACRSSTTNVVTEDDVRLLPLVFDIHGLTSCPLIQASYSGWLEKADEDCFVVVYPIGNIDNERWLVNRCWNLPGFLTDEKYGEVDGAEITTSPCCCYEKEDDEETENSMGFSLPTSEPDDPLFLRMVIDAVVDSFLEDDDEAAAASVDNAAEDATLIGANTTMQIDRARVYMAGHSNGCMTSLTMAALYSEEIAAVCCHAGALATPIPATSYSAVPVWMVHGMLDSTFAYTGASLLDMGPFGNFGTWPTVDVMNYIADQNDCDAEVHDDELYEEEEDGAVGVGKVYKRTNCTNTADVELVALYEVGHFPYSAAVIESFGETRATIDTTQLAWEFCSSHSKPNTSILPQTTENSTTEDSTNSTTETVDGETVHNEKEEKEEELSNSNNTISTVHDDEQEEQGKDASTPSTTDFSSAAAIASTPMTMMTCCILSIIGSMIN